MSLVVSQLKNKTMSLNVQDTGEDDLLLGASASPTAGELPSSTCEPIPILTKNYDDYDFFLGKTMIFLNKKLVAILEPFRNKKQ